MINETYASSTELLEGAHRSLFTRKPIPPLTPELVQAALNNEEVFIEATRQSCYNEAKLSGLIKIHSYSQNLLVITIHLQSTFIRTPDEPNLDFVAYKISRTTSQDQEPFKTDSYHIEATSNKIERSVNAIFGDLIYLLYQDDSCKKNPPLQKAELLKTPDKPELVQFLGEPSTPPSSETNPSPTSSSFSKAALIAAMILFSAAACFAWKKGYFSPKDAQQLNKVN